MNRVNQLPEVINLDDESHIEDHEIIHEALRGYDVEIASKANAEHTHQWAEIESTPETYPPSSHEHSASDINSGTLSIARIPVGTASGTVASGDDPRFTDARTPEDHTHNISEIETLQDSLNNKADLVGGWIPTSQIPAIALTKPFAVSDRAAMLALDVQEGDIAIITGENADKGTYILGSGPSNQFASWMLLSVSSDTPVQSVNGQVGTIVLSPSDIGAAPEGHSHTIAEVTSLQATLDGKAASSHTHAWSTITSKPTTFAPSAHKHPVTDVTATGTASASTYLRGDGSWATPPNTATWAEVSGKPATFPPESHTHTTAQVTGLDTALAGKADSTHSHTVAQVTGLQTALDGKVATSDSRLTNARTPTAHSHAIGDITNLQSTLDTISGEAPTWASITGKPSAFTPSSHTHAISEVTNLQSTLNSKADLVNNQIPTSQIPAVALTKPFPVTTRAQMLALTAQEGDIAIITAGVDKGTYVLGTGASSTFASWIPLASSVEVPVQSVNGQTGTIVLGVSDIGAAPASHTHTIANITNLQTTLDGKASTSHSHSWSEVTSKPTSFTPSAHGHSISEVTSLQATLDGKAASSHTHTIANITGLQAELDGKAASSHSHSWDSVTGKPSTFAPTIGSTATTAVAGNDARLTNARTPTAHTHAWGEVTGKPSTFAPTIGSTATTAVAGNDARLTNARTPTAHTHPVTDLTATGTRSSSTYLRGDNTWGTPTNTTYSAITQAEAENASSTTARLATGQRLRQAANAAITARIQLVSSFPASPVSGVLYLKAE